MIKAVRLDERMIHGQVTLKWCQYLGADRLVVADDTTANNPILKKKLMMAAPTTIKTAVVTMDKCVELCNDPQSKELNILVIVATPENLSSVVERCNGVSQINIGNYGRIAAKRGAEIRKSYNVNLYAYPDEMEVLKNVEKRGIPCNVQALPDDAPKKLSSLL